MSELPDDVEADVRAKAEEHLTAQTPHFAPGQLRVLGRRALEVVAPGVAEDHERRLLEDQEAGAYRRTTLRTRVNGDGTTEIHARIPDHAAQRLLGYLEAYTSPRVEGATAEATTGATDRRPYDERLGHAFVSYLEHTDPSRMPLHGGDATTIIVTIDLDALRHETNNTGLIGDQPVTPGHVRRLACTAGIIPASAAIPRCWTSAAPDDSSTPTNAKPSPYATSPAAAKGATSPPPGAKPTTSPPGPKEGNTNLADGVLLCSHHHHRIHDHHYTHHRQPDGTIRFHRRV